VAAAAGNVVPIYVDCTSRESFSDLKSKYDVKGYPTVLYLDPEGKQIREMGSREASAVTGEINSVARKFPGRPTFWMNSMKSAATMAKAAKKKVAVYVAKEDADPIKVTQALIKNLADRRTKLAWTWELGTAKALEGRQLESAPAVVIYSVGEKETDLTMLGKVQGDDPKLLNEGIDEILKNAKK
jgi:hypothetical protein